MQEQGFLHQPLVYLAAGAAIGPWGLALVTAPEAILHFAEFGVVLLLFLVGLELNPRRVWQLRRPIFGMGTAQVAATTAAVTLAGWALGLSPAVALVAGMGFAMSSTAIGLASLILTIMAAVKISNGELNYQYPFAIRLLK
jgi:glutathione-regulated potassium-efflux system ancillary protein KefC